MLSDLVHPISTMVIKMAKNFFIEYLLNLNG